MPRHRLRQTLQVATISVRRYFAVWKYLMGMAAWRRNSSAGKRRWGALAAAVTVPTLALAPITLSGAPAASASISARVTGQVAAAIPAPVQQGMATLVRGGDSGGGGLIGPSWWQAGVAQSTLVTYMQTTGDKSYESVIAAAFALKGGNYIGFEDHYDDDTAWWGLAWLQAYDLMGNLKYLTTAENLAAYIHKGGWDNTCGGGVWWRRSSDITSHGAKNAIANELFLELTAWLYNTTHITTFKTWALDEWAWFQKVGMISNGRRFTFDKKSYTVPAGLVTDGITRSAYNGRACSDGKSTPDTFTYNQGVILAALAQLYTATKDKALLRVAEKIAHAVLNSAHNAASNKLVTKNGGQGVLIEADSSCPATGTSCATGDGAAFKGIFVRDLKVLAVIAKTTQYNTFFKTQASSIDAHDTTNVTISHVHYRWFGFHWNGPPKPYAIATETSALEALIAALDLPK